MKTPVQMASKEPPQASPKKQQEHQYDHVSADNMKQQIKQELPHAAQGQETCSNVLGRMPVTKELQPEVEFGNPDMQVRPHTIPPVEDHRRRLLRRLLRKKLMMARHKYSGSTKPGILCTVPQLLQISSPNALGGNILAYGTASSSSGVHGNRAGAASSSSSSGVHGVRHSPNSNISAVGVNPNIAMAPDLQAPVQVVHHPVVEVPVEPPVVLFEPAFLPNWEDTMNLSNPGSLTIHPAVPEDIE